MIHKAVRYKFKLGFKWLIIQWPTENCLQRKLKIALCQIISLKSPAHTGAKCSARFSHWQQWSTISSPVASRGCELREIRDLGVWGGKKERRAKRHWWWNQAKTSSALSWEVVFLSELALRDYSNINNI